MPELTGLEIDQVTLRVSDVEQSAGFYAGLIGLRLATLDSNRAVLADPGKGGSTVLELIRAEAPGRAPRRAAGLFHVAYRYPDRDQLGAALQRLGSGTYHFTGASDHGVSEALYLDDPDGLGIELYWDRPREDWPQPHVDERIHMFTEPLDLGSLAAIAAAGAAEETAEGVDVGHVHLRVADLGEAERFWTDQIGLELMTGLPGAIFLAADGYHHHIGSNTWHSAGAPPAPSTGPGLDAISMSADAGAGQKTVTPEGVTVVLSS